MVSIWLSLAASEVVVMPPVTSNVSCHFANVVIDGTEGWYDDNLKLHSSYMNVYTYIYYPMTSGQRGLYEERWRPW